METVLITGGTGMIGTAVTKALVQNGFAVIILSRKSKPSAGRVAYAQWDPEKGTIDAETIKKADHIIHLAGANVADGRWSTKRKQEIINSRVKSGQLLVQALQTMPNKVQTVISASAIGWYGPDPQVPNPKPFIETDPPDTSFLGTTCQQWEDAIQPVTEINKRLVILRIGIVLSSEGGAYAEFKKPLRFGIASILGSGKQVVSWIHIDDIVNMILYALENKSIVGVYNAVAPNPVSNSVLIKSIAKANGGFSIKAPVPEIVLKAMLGEMSIEILKSTTASSRKIETTGYQFLFPHIDAATFNLNKKASV